MNTILNLKKEYLVVITVALFVVFNLLGGTVVTKNLKGTQFTPQQLQCDESEDQQPQAARSGDSQHRGFPPKHDISENQQQDDSQQDQQ